jgi:hypothetical protein
MFEWKDRFRLFKLFADLPRVGGKKLRFLPPRYVTPRILTKGTDYQDHQLKEWTMRAKLLTLQQRREIFHDLVLTQDVVPNVPHSRQIVTKKFEITEAQLRQIEEEGLEKEWPPLSEAVQEQEVG